MKKQIIVVDDDRGILEVLGVILGRAGYQTARYAEGHAILHDDFIEPDLFLIDKQLPDTDGLEICRFLKSREHRKETPVILFSAAGNLPAAAEAAGADGFLEKPFQINTLLSVIAQHIDRAAAS